MNNDFYCALIKLALDLQASTCRIVLTGAILSQGALYVIFRVSPPSILGLGAGALRIGKICDKTRNLGNFSFQLIIH